MNQMQFWHCNSILMPTFRTLVDQKDLGEGVTSSKLHLLTCGQRAVWGRNSIQMYQVGAFINQILGIVNHFVKFEILRQKVKVTT